MKIDRNRGKLTRKIDLSKFFGDQEAFILLGELSYDELVEWTKLAETARDKKDPRVMMQNIKQYVIDHNFESDFDGVTRKLTVDELWIELLKEHKIALHIQDEFISTLPLAKPSETK